MLNQPIVLLTFANDNDAYLEMLKLESHAIYQALEDVDNEQIIEVKREESATLDIIANRLNKYQEEVVIFHYSGHASGQHLQLEGSTANADGLAKLIASAPNIQLVVLNGCASYGQVETLLELGVKAVIATTVAIGDTKAKEFSEQFYNALGEYKSIQQAFKQAIGYLEAKYSNIDKAASKPKKGLKLKKRTEEKETIPWGLYYEDETVLNWRINHNLRLKSLLRDGSQRYYKKLIRTRYHFLEIDEGLLPQLSNETLEAYPNEDDQTTPLVHALSIAQQRSSPNIFIKGEVGKGKTVSLLHTWQTFSANNDRNQSIPIFVTLAEYNTSDHKKDFIINYIATHYLGKSRPTNEYINSIGELLKTPYQNMPFVPAVTLFLDGLDEMTSDSSGLIQEIKNIAETAKGTQIVITSQMDYGFTWLNPFLKCEVLELNKVQITTHLEASSLEVSEDSSLFKFLKTPMLLTLYSTSSSLSEQYKDDNRLEFKADINSYSELVWNFTESIIAKNNKDQSPQEFAYIKFMLRHFVPYLAFYTEKTNKYTLTKVELQEAISLGCNYIYQKAFLENFPFYISSFRKFGLQSKDWLEELERTERKISFIIKKLGILSSETIEGETIYYFTQRHYQGFFAAVHIYDDLKIALAQGKIPDSLANRKLSVHNDVSHHLGELCGEHYNTSDALKFRRTWQPNRLTRLEQSLKTCRNVFGDESTSNVVWNILTIWKRIRGHFADIDLSNLDLKDFLFDEVPLRHFRKLPVYPSSLTGSLLYDTNFISQGHTNSINAISYSPDGTRILSASVDRTIKEWSISTGKCLHTLEGHTDVVKSIHYHPDGTRAISGSLDGTIREWELAKNKEINNWEAHEGSVTCVRYTSDGKYFFSSGLDKTVKHWDVKIESFLQIFSNFTTPIVKISVHPNGQQFVTATRETSFQEWHLEEEAPIQTFEGHEGPVESVLYNHDGSCILSAAYDLKIKEWNTQTGQCLQTLEGSTKPIIDIHYVPNQKRAISCAGNSIKEWDLQTGECIRTLEATAVSSIDYHPTRTRLISGSWNNMINEWDAFSGRRLQTFEGYTNQVTALTLSPDNHFLYSGASDNSIRKWDTATGICVQTLEGHTDNVTSIVISNSNQLILSSSEDGTLKLWSATTGQCFRTIETEQGEIDSAVFNMDNRKILSAGHHLTEHASTIKEWNARTGECLKTLTTDNDHDNINAVIYSPDNSLIASAHNEKVIKIWDTATGDCLRILGENETGHSLAVFTIDFHPDGTHLISGSEDKTIRMWEVSTGECLMTIEAHTKPVENVRYNPTGTRFGSVSRDKKVKEWNAETGECLQTLEGHRELVNTLIYTNDGQFLYSGSSDNTIKKWETFKTKETKTQPSKSKLEQKKDKLSHNHEKREDERISIKNDIKKSKPAEEELGLFGSLVKLKGMLTNTIKDVIDTKKDDSIETLVSASGLHLQGADFRNLHSDSYFSNASINLMRQYGAIFSDEDEVIWNDLKTRLKKGR
jgi:WD40 repeat protein